MRAAFAIFLGLVFSVQSWADDPVAGREGRYLLLSEPHYRLGYCTRATEIELRIGVSGGLEARLRDRMIGGCQVVIDPEVRTYDLVPAYFFCGSVLYQGRQPGAEGDALFEMTDHRMRVCEDRQRARIITREIRSNGRVSNLYSQDAAPGLSESY